LKLEEEIKQEQFRNEYHKLAVNMFYTYGWLMRNNNQLFEKFGITPQQYNILRILRGQFPNYASINLLKERMLDKMSDASRLVERLREKGFINRNISENDRRKAQVIISPSGLEILNEIDKLDDKFDQNLSKLNNNEIKVLNKLLDKLRG